MNKEINRATILKILEDKEPKKLEAVNQKVKKYTDYNDIIELIDSEIIKILKTVDKPKEEIHVRELILHKSEFENIDVLNIWHSIPYKNEEAYKFRQHGFSFADRNHFSARTRGIEEHSVEKVRKWFGLRNQFIETYTYKKLLKKGESIYIINLMRNQYITQYIIDEYQKRGITITFKKGYLGWGDMYISWKEK